MKMFRRAIAGVALLLALVLALGAAAPYLIDGQTVRDQLVSRLSAWAEGKLRVNGEVHLQSLFDLTIKAADVEILSPQGFPQVSEVHAEVVEARLNRWAFLNGRVVFDKVWVQKPVISLREGLDGLPADSHWRMLMLNDPPVLERLVDSAQRAPFTYIDLENGQIVSSSDRPLDTFSIVVRRDETPSLVTAYGNAVWDQKPIEFRLERGPFQPAGPTREARTRFEVEGAGLGRVMAQGRIVRANGTRFVGNIDVSEASLAVLARWLGLPAGDALGPMSYTASGAIEATVDAVSLQQFELDIGDTQATGLISLSLDKDKPMLTGTLGLNAVNLRDLTLSEPHNGVFAMHDPMRMRRGGTSAPARDIGEWLQTFDADLRLSAGSLQFDEMTSGETAAFLSVNEGRATFNVAGLMVFGGLVNGQFSLRWQGDGFRLEGKGNAAGIQLEQLLMRAGVAELASGRADLSFAVAGTGATLGTLMRNARVNGEILALQGGEVALDVASLAERGHRQRLVHGRGQSGVEIAPGRGEYVMLQCDFRFAGERLSLDRLEMLQDGWMIRGGGRADLSMRSTEWRLRAERVSASRETQADLSAIAGVRPLAEDTISMHLTGSLTRPRVIFESQASGQLRGKRAGWP